MVTTLQRRFFVILIFLGLFLPFQESISQTVDPSAEIVCRDQVTLPFKDALLEDHEAPLNPDLMHDHSRLLSPYKYEQALAKHNDLDISEVMGLTRNFHDGIVTTGELGFFRKDKDLVVLKDFNLMGAYKWGLNNLDVSPTKGISASDIVELRKKTIQWFFKKTGAIRTTHPFEFKNDKSSAILADKLDQKVLDRLKAYGHEVTLYPSPDSAPEDIKNKIEKFKIKMQPNAPGYYVIKYPAEEVLRQDLVKFTEDVNKLIKARAPPEYIAAFVVQDLLLLHPFHDGNGRTARLLGQIIYKKLTGKTIIFPQEFHKEMNFSTEELAQKLLLPKGVATVFDPDIMITEEFWKLSSFDEIIKQFFMATGKIPELSGNSSPTAEGESAAKAPTKISLLDQNFHYEELPASLKSVPENHMLFYGKGMDNEKSADSIIKNIFFKGRERREAGNTDVYAHTVTTKNYASSFLQSTVSLGMGARFTKNKEFGMIFVIDPKGLPLLRVNELFAHAKSLSAEAPDNKYPEEEEILIYMNLPADHVPGVVLVDRDAVPQKILINTNYKKN